MARKKVRSVVKPSSEMARARELIAEVVPEARWRLMFARLSETAQGDGPLAKEAAKLLKAYAFAIPAQPVADEKERYD